MPDPDQYAEWPEYEAVPDRSAEYHHEPTELRRLRALFLEALRENVPEVLASLRKMHEHYSTSEEPDLLSTAFGPLLGWAEEFSLVNIDCYLECDWLIAAAWKTIAHWRDHPEDLDPPRWSPTACETIHPGPLSERVWKQSGLTQPLTLQLPGWHPQQETLEQYKQRIMGMVRKELDRRYDEHETAMTKARLKRPPRKSSLADHFSWLALYQGGRLSYAAISGNYQTDRPTVTQAVQNTAKLLIGPYWRTWLRPPLKGGRPRKQ
jgi:hypothetical protein